jgi:hypothetical protein
LRVLAIIGFFARNPGSLSTEDADKNGLNGVAAAMGEMLFFPARSFFALFLDVGVSYRTDRVLTYYELLFKTVTKMFLGICR